MNVSEPEITKKPHYWLAIDKNGNYVNINRVSEKNRTSLKPLYCPYCCDKGNFKEFAAELSLITRLFLEDRYLFPGAELPTGELKEEIAKYIVKIELLEGMHKLLEITDYVKFAKFIPLEAELKGFLDFAYELVDKLKEESKKNNV